MRGTSIVVGAWIMLTACGPGTVGNSSAGTGEGESGEETGPQDTVGEDVDEDEDDGANCVPGQSNPCACTNGDMGAQLCADDGQSYGPCMCEGGETTDEESGESTDEETGDTTDTTDTTEDSTEEETGPVDCLPQDEAWPGSYEIDSNDDIAGIANYSAIAGSLTIQGVGVTSLEGLECLRFIGNQIYVAQTTVLTDLKGLDNVEIMQGELEIYGNIGLLSLDGLGSLQSAGWISIGNNDSLASVAELSSLDNVGGGFTIEKNPELRQCDAFALADQVDIGGLVCIFENQVDRCPDSCG